MAGISVAVFKFEANQKALIPFHRTTIDHPANQNEYFPLSFQYC